MEKYKTKTEEEEKIIMEIPNEEKKSKSKKTKNKKTFLSITIVGIIFLIVIIFSTIFAIANINNENILNGIKIEEIDMSGLSKEEAKSKLELIYNEKKQKDILLKYEDYDATINPELLETNYNIDKAINEAILIGKDSNIFINNYNIIFSFLGKKNINVEMKINEEVTKQTIEDISVNIPGAVVESAYYI